MQSQEPPASDDEIRPAGGHARHRRRRTDPPMPPEGTPLFRKEPPPLTVGDLVSRRGGGRNGGRGTDTTAARTGPHRPVAPRPVAGAPVDRGPAGSHADSGPADGHGPADRDPWAPRPGQGDGHRDEHESDRMPPWSRATTLADPGPATDPGPVSAPRPVPRPRTRPDASMPDPAAPLVDRPYGTPGDRTGTGPSTDDGWPTGYPTTPPAPPAPGPVDDASTARVTWPGLGDTPDTRPGTGPDAGDGTRSAPVAADEFGFGAAGAPVAPDVVASRTGSHARPDVSLDEPDVDRPRPVAHEPHEPWTDGPDDGRFEPDDRHHHVVEPDAPRRFGRRRPPPEDRRTVSDVARERGLPVPDYEPAGTGPQAPVPPAGHGHGHGHGPATPAGRRVRILLAALLVPCALAALAGVALLWPGASPIPTIPPQQQIHGQVQAVQAADCTPGSGSGGCTGVTVRMTDGPRSGSDLVQLVPAEPTTPRFAVGDDVVLAWSGADPDQAGSYQITDFQRGVPLVWLAAAFAVAVIALGRWRGLAALVALGLSFVILVLFVLPSILSGNNPLAVAVTGAGVIMFVVLYLSHGFSARTSCAVLGTLVSLVLIGVLGALFSATTRLTGLDDTTANLIGTVGNVPIDARGLVLAGLVIGALGVLDDVTVTQASAVWELRDANPSLGSGALFAAGMRIGRDHVSSAVNTLVLAYAGAALPLMLLFTVSSAGFGQVLTSQDVATEIVRTLVGSIGLVASVPVTTGLAAVVAARR